MSKSKFGKLMDSLGLDETYTKPGKKVKYDHVKQLIPPLQDYNFMADLIMLPKTSQKYRYLFTIVDLWSDEFDCEPLKTKEPQEVLKAMLKIFKGPYLKMPYASLATDAGTEFKGVFQKWLYDKSIYHKIALPNRHKQQGNIENLNRLLVRFLTSYMNKKENETGEEYTDWVEILPTLKKSLNKMRKRDDQNPYTYEYAEPINKTPKYKVGDVVIRKLDTPKNALNNKESGKFRTGDYRFDVKEPREIVKVLYYPNNIRYVLKGIKNVSYTEEELLPSKDSNESKYAVKSIIDKTTRGKKVYYKVWYKGELKKQALWILKSQLIEDGLEDYIDKFENS